MTIQIYPVERMVYPTEKKVIFAIRVIDDYTLKEPIGWINISIKDSNSVPVKNPSGYYVFADLPAGSYVIEIDVASQYYFRREITVNSDDFLYSNFPVLDIYLIPNSTYLFYENTVLIRGIVREFINEKAGKYLCKANVQALVCNPNEASKARLINSPVSIGDHILRVADVKGAIVAGDSLMLKDTNESCNEVITIVSNEKSGSLEEQLNIEPPLEFDHNGKNPLMPILNTFTNDKGEFVIYFRIITSNQFKVRLKVDYPLCKTFDKEVEISINKHVPYVEILLTKA